MNTNSGETATCTVVKKGVGLVPDGDFSRAIQDITADETTINVMASDFGSGALCNSQTLYCKVLSPVVAQLSALTVEIRIIQEGGGYTIKDAQGRGKFHAYAGHRRDRELV